MVAARNLRALAISSSPTETTVVDTWGITSDWVDSTVLAVFRVLYYAVFSRFGRSDTFITDFQYGRSDADLRSKFKTVYLFSSNADTAVRNPRALYTTTTTIPPVSVDEQISVPRPPLLSPLP